MPLVGQAGVLDDGHRRVRRQAAQQLLLDGGGAAHTHVNHQGELGVSGGAGQGFPVGAGVAGLGMAGDKHHAVGMLAVGERCAQGCEARQASGNAIDHRHRHACRAQVFHLFAATAKDERVAPLEAHHVLTLVHGHQHQFFDEGLGRAFAATALAHVNDAGAG